MRWLALFLVVACGKHATVERRGDVPTVVTITAGLPGASVSDLEAAIANPLEDAAAQVHGVAALRTRIAVDGVTVVVEPEPEVDASALAQELNAAIAKVLRQLPPAAMPPELRMTPAHDRVVMRYLVSGEAAAASRWQDEVATLELERLAGVGQITLCGTRTEEWKIDVDPKALAARGKNLGDLVTELETRDLDGTKPLPPQLDGTLAKDTALVGLAAAPRACRAISTFGDVIAVTIVAQSGADLLEVRERLETKLAELTRALPQSLHVLALPRTKPIAVTVEATPQSLETLSSLVGEVHDVALLLVQETRSHDVAEIYVVPVDPDRSVRVEADLTSALSAAHVTLRTRAQVMVEILGPDLAKLRELAATVAAAFPNKLAGKPGLDEAPQLAVDIDRGRAADLGVHVSDITQALRAASDDGIAISTIHGLGTIRIAGRGAPIVVRLLGQGSDAERLHGVSIAAMNHQLVPLDSVVTMRNSSEPAEILHDNRQRYVGVRIAASPDEIHAVLDKLAIPPGYRTKLVAPE